MTLVLGIDSSTQSTKALLVDAATGEVVEERRAAHPDGTEVDPRAWLAAVDEAAGPLLERAEAVAVGGQQHGMVLLDGAGEVVRPALLWNDTRSAPQAAALIEEQGGAGASVGELGSLLVASFTSSKLRWVRDEEPEAAERARSVLLPHDYVSLHLAAPGTEPFTDRGDASGTGYYSTAAEAWRPELAEAAIGRSLDLPRLPGAPQEAMARTAGGAVIAAGTGDNMGAALGLGQQPGDVSISIGTSGVCAMVSDVRPDDPSGTVTGFADATGRFLPMTTTINASRILEAGRALLGVTHEQLSALALASVPGAHGVSLLPYLEGERTPNRPDARGTLTGLTTSTTREDLARAYVEALLCSLADGVAALEQVTGVSPARVTLIGGGARSRAVQELAPAVLGRPVTLAPDGEYVALGAARQAAWALAETDEPPVWELGGARTLEAEATPEVLDAYRALKERTEGWG
ncbi:xylulokinase [Brachybacterium sp. NBEC-018]|uniref:xylulokinase n=1 Tax=Brachybacterium sp. NBEC-018 TaxID=2996004 RepID=UPI0021754009|nr:xylulokinase [Brachybacterium sp. NBEC-018]UVY84413.1 xylulokinase [Brachybacterium sp. NBEC-018]